MERLRAHLGIACLSGLAILLGQNCGPRVDFSVKEASTWTKNDDTAADTEPGEDVFASDPDIEPDEPVVCDPLLATKGCGGDGQGLRGAVYSLTTSNFPGGLNSAVLEDYFKLGDRVLGNIIMSSVNVPQQDWDKGFEVSPGDYIKNRNGELLFEYFAIELDGYIHFPKQAGNQAIELATLSDDGMRVYVDGEVIIEDDGTHAPRWACSGQILAFAAGEKKEIRVEYFQGPRTQIAMQLYYRAVQASPGPCGSAGEWKLLGPENFSHWR